MASVDGTWRSGIHSGGKKKGNGKGQPSGGNADDLGSPDPSMNTPKLGYGTWGLSEHHCSPRSGATGSSPHTTTYASGVGSWADGERRDQTQQHAAHGYRPVQSAAETRPQFLSSFVDQYARRDEFAFHEEWVHCDDYMTAHFQSPGYMSPAHLPHHQAFAQHGSTSPHWQSPGQSMPAVHSSPSPQPVFAPQARMLSPQTQGHTCSPDGHGQNSLPQQKPLNAQGQSFTSQHGPSLTNHGPPFPPQQQHLMQQPACPPEHGQSFALQRGQNQLPQHAPIAGYTEQQVLTHVAPHQEQQSAAQDVAPQQHPQNNCPQLQVQNNYPQPQVRNPFPPQLRSNVPQQGQYMQEPQPQLQQELQSFQQPQAQSTLRQPQRPNHVPLQQAQNSAQQQQQQQQQQQRQQQRQQLEAFPQHQEPPISRQGFMQQVQSDVSTQDGVRPEGQSESEGLRLSLTQGQMMHLGRGQSPFVPNAKAPTFVPYAQTHGQSTKHVETRTACVTLCPANGNPTPPEAGSERASERTKEVLCEKAEVPQGRDEATLAQSTQVAESHRTSEAVSDTQDSESTTEPESTDEESCAEVPERPPVAADLAQSLENFTPESVPHVEEFLLCTLRVAERPDELALALYARAGDATFSHLVADLIGALSLRLPAFPADGHMETLVQKVWLLCREDLKAIAGETPPETAHGTVLLAAELYVRSLLPMSAVKDVFAALLFCRPHPPDHAVSLACHLFLRTGATLDRCDVGSRMIEYLVLRLKEVKGGNLSSVTRQSITDVVDLRNHKWVMVPKKGKEPKKTAGQKKARAAARNRARALVQRADEGATTLWPELQPDADALNALVELAQSRDPVAEDALALVLKFAEADEESRAREELRSALVSSTAENPKARDALLQALGM